MYKNAEPYFFELCSNPDYYEKFYGPVAKEMEAFFTLVENSWTEIQNDQNGIQQLFKIIDEALRKTKGTIYHQRIAKIYNYIGPLRSILKRLRADRQTKITTRGKLNDKQKIKLEVDKIGAFYLENLELNFGENTIIYENESFGFLLEKPSILTVQLNKIHLFLGRYDPLTQKAFEIQELNDIVRCKDCRNFLYDFSVEENEGRCMIKNCESKAFYNAKNAKFWVK